MMRLDRFLSGQTAYSRSQIAQAVRRGQVLVDGVPAKNPDMKIDPGCCRVTLSGTEISYQKQHHFLLHKPVGILTAARDASQKTVMDLLRNEDRLPGLFPSGRLDRDTSGMLLITDDGVLSHNLLSPRHHVAKYYLAALRDPFDPAYIPQFAAGISLREGDTEEACLPADCVQIAERLAVLELHEGRYHQVRRMFAAAGNHVENLLRFQVGSLQMPPDLAPGAYLHISDKEINMMLKTSTVSCAADFCARNYSSYWIKET